MAPHKLVLLLGLAFAIHTLTAAAATASNAAAPPRPAFFPLEDEMTRVSTLFNAGDIAQSAVNPATLELRQPLLDSDSAATATETSTSLLGQVAHLVKVRPAWLLPLSTHSFYVR